MSLLSLELPTERSLPYRRLYILAEIAILLLFDVARLNHSDLSSLLIIKACLLLPRSEAIASTALLCVLSLTYFWQVLPELIAEAENNTPPLNPQRILSEASISVVGTSVFVVLMGFVFAAEQRTRRRAEQLAEEVEMLATKLERSRIARDIHDSLGHSLTTLDVQLALAERYSRTEGRELKLQQSLGKAKQLTAQCLAEARQSLQTMRDPNFDLAAALRTLSEQMRQSFLIDLQVKLPPISQQLSYQLFLMAKEGLVNVQKHANATRVNLSVLAIADTIILTLTDDGCGFDVNQSDAGYGLQGIRERSQLLGGQMMLQSTHQQGTRLEVTILSNVGTSALTVVKSVPGS